MDSLCLLQLSLFLVQSISVTLMWSLNYESLKSATGSVPSICKWPSSTVSLGLPCCLSIAVILLINALRSLLGRLLLRRWARLLFSLQRIERPTGSKCCPNCTSRSVPYSSLSTLHTKILLIGTENHLFKKCWSWTFSLKWTVGSMQRTENVGNEDKATVIGFAGLKPFTSQQLQQQQQPQTDRQLRHLSSPLPFSLVACFYIPRGKTSNRPLHLTTGGSLPVWLLHSKSVHRATCHRTSRSTAEAANQFALIN